MIIRVTSVCMLWVAFLALCTAQEPIADHAKLSCNTPNGGIAGKQYSLGDTIQMCLFLAHKTGVNAESTYQKMLFQVPVDQYTSLHWANSFLIATGGKPEDLTTTTTTIAGGMFNALFGATTIDSSHLTYAWISLHALDARPLNCSDAADMNARQSFVTCPLLFQRGSNLMPMSSLVFNLQYGKIDSLVWDNRCDACSPRSIECGVSARYLRFPELAKGVWGEGDDRIDPQYGMCGTQVSQCLQNQQGTCDLKIFITWAGQDRSGVFAKSGNLRFSRFSGLSVRSLYQSAMSVLTF